MMVTELFSAKMVLMVQTHMKLGLKTVPTHQGKVLFNLKSTVNMPTINSHQPTGFRNEPKEFVLDMRKNNSNGTQHC